MPRSTGERGEPTPTRFASSAAVQNITVVSEVIEYEADLGRFHATLPATFHDSPLIVHNPPHDLGRKFFKHQRLGLLVRHLLQIVPQWLILRI